MHEGRHLSIYGVHRTIKMDLRGLTMKGELAFLTLPGSFAFSSTRFAFSLYSVCCRYTPDASAAL